MSELLLHIGEFFCIVPTQHPCSSHLLCCLKAAVETDLLRILRTCLYFVYIKINYYGLLLKNNPVNIVTCMSD
jgi:hypothetical protein